MPRLDLESNHVSTPDEDTNSLVDRALQIILESHRIYKDFALNCKGWRRSRERLLRSRRGLRCLFSPQTPAKKSLADQNSDKIVAAAARLRDLFAAIHQGLLEGEPLVRLQDCAKEASVLSLAVEVMLDARRGKDASAPLQQHQPESSWRM